MTTNDITGDALRTRPATDAYRDNFDEIFRKPKEKQEEPETAKEKPLEDQTCNP